MASVAVFDNSPETLEVFHHVLGQEHRVMAHAQGAIAGDFIRENRPDIAFVGLDLKDVDPLGLIERVTATQDAPSVVAIASTPEPEKIVQAIHAGAADATCYPLLASEVQRCVAGALFARESQVQMSCCGQERSGLVGHSDQMKRVGELISRYAASEAPVLVTGETGVGKELVARAIHGASRRADGSLEVRNCGAIPETLIESELLGTAAGAYTGAIRRAGAFERADSGTLFLDEIGELSPMAQVKLLRAVETGKFHRVGGSREVQSDFRVVAATNRDLVALMHSGEFRADLYYRISVLRLTIPPLRERREDIPELVQHFTSKVAESEPIDPGVRFSSNALARLCEYDWPGNVRELRNVVYRSLVMNTRPVIRSTDVMLG